MLCYAIFCDGRHVLLHEKQNSSVLNKNSPSKIIAYAIYVLYRLDLAQTPT
jgi:hypothetical protein